MHLGGCFGGLSQGFLLWASRLSDIADGTRAPTVRFGPLCMCCMHLRSGPGPESKQNSNTFPAQPCASLTLQRQSGLAAAAAEAVCLPS